MAKGDVYTDYMYPMVIVRTTAGSVFDTEVIERMTSFEFHDELNKVDMARLHISYDEAFARNDPFEIDSRWIFRWGYPHDMSNPREMRLKFYEPDFPQDGAPVCLLTFMAAGAIKLTQVKKASNWGLVTTSEIAKKLAKRYHLKSDVDDSNDKMPEPYMQPSNLSDWEYLHMLADEADFEVVIENGILFYKSRDTKRNEAPRVELVYGGDYMPSPLLRFHPKISGKKGKVKVSSANTKSGKHAQSVASNATTSQKTSLGHLPPQPAHPIDVDSHPKGTVDREVSAMGETKKKTIFSAELETGVLTGLELKDSADHSITSATTQDNKAKQLATSIKRSFLERAVEAEAECIGSPRFRAKINFSIQVPERRLSGLWYGHGAVHKIDSNGYNTRLDLKRGAYNVPKAKRTKDAPKTNDSGVKGAGDLLKIYGVDVNDGVNGFLFGPRRSVDSK